MQARLFTQIAFSRGEGDGRRGGGEEMYRELIALLDNDAPSFAQSLSPN